MTRLLFLCAAVALAAPVLAEPAPPSDLPQPGLAAELLISLAVAEARCTGAHRQMVARYRPKVMQSRANEYRLAGQEMSQRYAVAYGAQWRAALAADMASMRDRFAQQPDLKRFCRHAAIQARELSNVHESAYGVFYDNHGQLRPGSVLLGPLPW